MGSGAESIIRHMIELQQTSWNAGDAHTFATRFHPQGSFTNILGHLYFGRTAFEQVHAAVFATIFRGSTLRLTARRIYFPTPTLAVVDLDAALEGFQSLPPGVHRPADAVLRTRLLEVMSEDVDGWWIVAYHNVDIKPGSRDPGDPCSSPAGTL